MIQYYLPFLRTYLSQDTLLLLADIGVMILFGIVIIQDILSVKKTKEMWSAKAA